MRISKIQRALKEQNGPTTKYQLDLWLANAQIATTTATGALFRSMLFALQGQLPPGQ